MNQDILEPIFLELTADTSGVGAILDKDTDPLALRQCFSSLPFNVAYDYLRGFARDLTTEERAGEAVDTLSELVDAVEQGMEASTVLADVHVALLLILAGMKIHTGDYDEAMRFAGKCLSRLAQNPKRRDEPFLSVLAAILYDVARLHSFRGEFRQAEREIEKSAKIYERLARMDSDRYGAAHLLVVAAATRTYTSRVRQANMLAHFHTATGAYMDMLGKGAEGAADKLVESLEQEGKTLARMGRHREAVQYFTRALKYLTKIKPEMSIHQLELSVNLGEALLQVKGSRDKGVHLLNTLLHKASRLNADELHKRIVEILLNTRTGGVDILGFWHKIFPK